MKKIKLFEQFIKEGRKMSEDDVIDSFEESVSGQPLLESTNSQLGKIDKRGRIKSVYVHSEGYPEHMVPVIKKYDKKGVDQLLKLGSSGISFLDKKIGKKQNFNNPVSGTTLFYGRDRGEHYDMTTKWNDAADLKGYFNEVGDSGAEYVYLYDERDGNWYMGKPFNGDDKLQLVESVVTEAEIKSDDEFKEYAFTVLQKAFGEDFDEAKAQEVVDGILGKVDGDYGKAAGILQSSLD